MHTCSEQYACHANTVDINSKKFFFVQSWCLPAESCKSTRTNHEARTSLGGLFLSGNHNAEPLYPAIIRSPSFPLPIMLLPACLPLLLFLGCHLSSPHNVFPDRTWRAWWIDRARCAHLVCAKASSDSSEASPQKKKKRILAKINVWFQSI